MSFIAEKHEKNEVKENYLYQSKFQNHWFKTPPKMETETKA